jgi:hypothetical protein
LSLKARVEQVLKDEAGSESDLTDRYAVDETERDVVRVGARHQLNVADSLDSDILVGHSYADPGLQSCEIRLAEDGFLIEWVQDPAGDYLLVREARAG